MRNLSSDVYKRWVVRENILHQSKRNTWTLNLEPALILALTKIRPRIEVLACQKQAQLLINRLELRL
jgi:hypothetical protein